MNVVGLPSFPCLCVNIICVFFVLLNSKSIVADDDQLSVTSYGSFEIAMLANVATWREICHKQTLL